MGEKLICLYESKYEHLFQEFINQLPSLKFELSHYDGPIWLYVEEDKIKAILSYHDYDDCYLIHSFIFYRDLSETIIKELYDTMENSLRHETKKVILSVCRSEETVGLFTRLGFVEFDGENVYINDEKANTNEWKQGIFMKKELSQNMGA